MCASSSSSQKILRIGIVGFGTFGQFLAKTMINQGHILRVTSRTDYSLLSDQLGISFFREVNAFLEAENDVVLICTSILSLPQVVKSLPFHCLKRPTLFVDVLSVKECPKDICLQLKKSLCLPLTLQNLQLGIARGIGFSMYTSHVLTRKWQNGWQGPTVMDERVRVKDETTCSIFLNIFQTEGCEMLEMTCKELDKMVTRSQFITQYHWQGFVGNGD